jgi:cell division protein ZapA
MKQVEVTILGQTYMLGCPEGGETSLLAAVNHVDREMVTIRDNGKVKARERIAVLAALNLAFALAERPHANPVHDSQASAAQINENASLDVLVRRIDQVLGADGHLF